MNADITEALRERIVLVLANCGNTRRRIRNFGSVPDPSQLAKLEAIEREAADTDRAVRELFHLLPEELRPFRLPRPRRQHVRKPDGLKTPRKYEPKPGGKLPREVRWPTLKIGDILALADEYHVQHGKWPNKNSGLVSTDGPDTWCGIHKALKYGTRGLPGGTTLAKLLADQMNLTNRTNLPHMDIDTILAWADAYYARTQAWPNVKSGRIPETERETWTGVNHALARGQRGLAPTGSIARLLEERRGVRHFRDRSPLSETEILAWADAYHHRTGMWPKRISGEIPESPGDQWKTINSALVQGYRMLPGQSSLAKLLAAYHRKQNMQALPTLVPDDIEMWARNHFARCGRWPSSHPGGVIEEAPEEDWRNLHGAFKAGRRGLAETGCKSLSEFLDKRIGKLVSHGSKPWERVAQADAHPAFR